MSACFSPAKLSTTLIIALLLCCAEARVGKPELTCDSEQASTESSVFVEVDEFQRSIGCVPDEERIFFFITRGWDSIQDKNEAFLEALFISNPHSKVFFVSLTAKRPSTALFDLFLARGYYIKGYHSSCDELVKSGWFVSSKNKQWLDFFCGNPTSQYFYTHLTDYMRFTLLYLYGGMYTDTDSIFLRSIPSGEFVGLDFASPDVKKEPPPPWIIDPSKNIYAAPGVLRLRRGSAVAKFVLENTFGIESYDPDCFNCVGPKAMNLALKEVPEKDHRIRLLKNSILYPLPFFKVHRVFEFNEKLSPSSYLRHLMRSSVALHLFGTVSSKVNPGKASPYAIMRKFFSLSQGRMPASETLPCEFGGIESLVRKRKRLRLNNENVVFLRDCPSLRDDKVNVLSIKVRKGRIALRGRDFGNEAHFGSMENLAQINQVMSDIEYVADGLRNITDDNVDVRITAGERTIANKLIPVTNL